jgi:hypothetical protein
MDKFLAAIQSAATNPLAYGAYVITVAAWVIIAWRISRHRILLEHISALPPQDRLSALSLEMGTVQVKGGLSPEQWLRSRIHAYYFGGFCVVCATIFGIAAMAYYFYSGSVQSAFGLEN